MEKRPLWPSDSNGFVNRRSTVQSCPPAPKASKTKESRVVEEWRQVASHANYQVSDLGRVRRSAGGRGTYAGRAIAARRPAATPAPPASDPITERALAAEAARLSRLGHGPRAAILAGLHAGRALRVSGELERQALADERAAAFYRRRAARIRARRARS